MSPVFVECLTYRLSGFPSSVRRVSLRRTLPMGRTASSSAGETISIRVRPPCVRWRPHPIPLIPRCAWVSVLDVDRCGASDSTSTGCLHSASPMDTGKQSNDELLVEIGTDRSHDVDVRVELDVPRRAVRILKFLPREEATRK